MRAGSTECCSVACCAIDFCDEIELECADRNGVSSDLRAAKALPLSFIHNNSLREQLSVLNANCTRLPQFRFVASQSG